MKAKPAKPQPVVDFNDGLEIKTNWQAEFSNCMTGEKFTRKIDKLIDFGAGKRFSAKYLCGNYFVSGRI